MRGIPGRLRCSSTAEIINLGILAVGDPHTNVTAAGGERPAAHIDSGEEYVVAVDLDEAIGAGFRAEAVSHRECNRDERAARDPALRIGKGVNLRLTIHRIVPDFQQTRAPIGTTLRFEYQINFSGGAVDGLEGKIGFLGCAVSGCTEYPGIRIGRIQLVAGDGKLTDIASPSSTNCSVGAIKGIEDASRRE